MITNLDNNFFKVNFRDNYFWKVFCLILIIITFIVILFGPKDDVYYKQFVEYGHTGFRPLGSLLILYLLSLFFETSVPFIAVFINGIFFSFIFSCICTISKNCNSNSFLTYLIFSIFLSPLFHEVFVIRETLFYAFLTMLLVINFNNWETKSVFFGLILGLLYITRPTGIVAIIAFILVSLFILFLKENKKVYLKYFLNTIFWFLLVVGISIGIFYFKFGVLIISSSCSSALNLFIGLSATESMAYIFTDMGEYVNQYEHLHPNRATICQDIGYYSNLLKEVASNVSLFDFIKSVVVKMILFFFSYLPIGTAEISLLDNNQINVDNFQYNTFRILISLVSIIPSSFILVIFFYRYSNNLLNRNDFFLFLYCLGHGAVYSITWPEARYRFPIDPILVVYLLSSLNKDSFETTNIIKLLNKYMNKIINNLIKSNK